MFGKQNAISVLNSQNHYPVRGEPQYALLPSIVLARVSRPLRPPIKGLPSLSISSILHFATSQRLGRLILGLRLAFGVTASLCLR
jgi:hypothetical protein